PGYVTLPHLPSFPTRRSSDLEQSCDPDDLVNRTGCAAPLEAHVEITPQRVLASGHIDAKNHADLRHGKALKPGAKYTVEWETLRSEEHTSELQSRENLVCRLL